jgi:hypothetical protein
MKRSVSLFSKGALAFLFMFLSLSSHPLSAQTKTEIQKIGVYDSRVITFAWSRSSFFRDHQVKFAHQSDSAEKARDTARIRELSVHAVSYQHLLHQMVFSSGSVSAVIDLVRDKLPDVAKAAGVIMIVSKYELNYKDPSVEVVDLTGQIAQLFKPAENIDKMAGEISKSEPVPLEDLDIEQELWDLYCKRFGK